MKKTKILTVSMPKSVKDKLDKFAKKKGMKRSEVVNKAILKMLEKKKNKAVKKPVSNDIPNSELTTTNLNMSNEQLSS